MMIMMTGKKCATFLLLLLWILILVEYEESLELFQDLKTEMENGDSGGTFKFS